MLTVISILTMFLVVLLDDTVLAADGSTCQKNPKVNLPPIASEGMISFALTQRTNELVPSGFIPMEAM